MAIATGCGLWSAVHYLRESWVQFYGTMGLNATGQKRTQREGSLLQTADCRAGVEGSLSLDTDILLSLPSPENSIAIL